MAHKITDACVSCGTCAENCPVEAISQGDSQYVIDADTCVDCGACAAGLADHPRPEKAGRRLWRLRWMQRVQQRLPVP